MLALLLPLALASHLYPPLSEDCTSVKFDLCIQSQKFAGKATPSNLLGWWTFDDPYGHDSTAHTNTVEKLVTPGPAISILYLGGKGASLYFDGESEATIPHISPYETSEFTLSFWVFLVQDSTGGWRTILHKGSSAYELTPSVFLWPKERRFHIRVSTAHSWNEGLDSVSVLNLRKWTHLSVSGNGQLL